MLNFKCFSRNFSFTEMTDTTIPIVDFVSVNGFHDLSPAYPCSASVSCIRDLGNSLWCLRSKSIICVQRLFVLCSIVNGVCKQSWAILLSVSSVVSRTVCFALGFLSCKPSFSSKLLWVCSAFFSTFLVKFIFISSVTCSLFCYLFFSMFQPVGSAIILTTLWVSFISAFVCLIQFFGMLNAIAAPFLFTRTANLTRRAFILTDFEWWKFVVGLLGMARDTSFHGQPPVRLSGCAGLHR